jgi:hypothetical protein
MKVFSCGKQMLHLLSNLPAVLVVVPIGFLQQPRTILTPGPTHLEQQQPALKGHE